MYKAAIIIGLGIFMYSCNSSINSEKILVPDTNIHINVKIDADPAQGDTITLIARNNTGYYTASGFLDSLHPRIFVKFTNPKPGNLKGLIQTPRGGGNIRFNQILFPDKTSDGPFGQELNYELKMTGDYILVIGSSQMADNPYVGKFQVMVNMNL